MGEVYEHPDICVLCGDLMVRLPALAKNAHDSCSVAEGWHEQIDLGA